MFLCRKYHIFKILDKIEMNCYFIAKCNLQLFGGPGNATYKGSFVNTGTFLEETKIKSG